MKIKNVIILLFILMIIPISVYSADEDFYLDDNGVTILCPDASNGESGTVDGITYTKRDETQINTSNANKSCTSGITDMSNLFEDETDFNQDISHWDTSSVTDMSSMFVHAGAFNQDIGDWDVSNVNDMDGMFFFADSFNQDIGDWDVSSVTDMFYMFANSPFDQDIGDWDTSSVTHMYQMFANSPFDQDIGDWDVSNVIDMDDMFTNSPFNQDLSRWCVPNIDSEPTDFGNDGTNPDWDTCKYPHIKFQENNNVNYTLSVYNNSSKTDLLYDLTSNVRGYTQKYLDSGNDYYYIASNETSLYENNFTLSNCEDSCESEFRIEEYEMEFLFYLHDNDVTIMCPLASKGESGTVDGVTYTKRNETEITTSNANISCTSGITDMSSMFVHAGAFNQDISHWDTSSVNDMSSMFYSADSFDQDIGDWDTSSVTHMY
ncbi:MAG: BspA family leucine-rich repeat surface protein, partial [bacterium]